MTLRPFIDYSGYEHCLGADIAFIHPKNGNVYAIACEKRNGVGQDISIYRMRFGGPIHWELVKRYVGGVDAVGQFAAPAGLKIDRFGAMFVALTCQLPNDPGRTKTGFQNVWDWVPNVDEAY